MLKLTFGSLGIALLVGLAWAAGEGPLAGNPLWEDIFVPPQQDGNVVLSFLAKEGDRIFAAGSGPNHNGPSINPYLIVRAYDAETGTLLWQTGRIDGFNETLAGLGVEEGRVFAAGTARPGYNRCCWSYVVRAYDAATGSVLWEDRLARNCDPGPCPTASEASSLAVDGGRVFVGGYRCEGPYGPCPSRLRTYAAATGDLLWEADLASSYPAQGGVVVVAKAGQVIAASRSILEPLVVTLRAYDAVSGGLRWEDTLSDGRLSVLTAGPRRVFVARRTVSGSSIRAYDLPRGDVLWESVLPGASLSVRQLVAEGGKRLFAIGADTFARPEASISAFDAATGDLQWEDRLHDQTANAVAIHGDQAFVAGSVSASSMTPLPDCFPYCSSLFFVRAYEARTGERLWETVSPPTACPNFSRLRPGRSEADAIAAAHGRVFAAGLLWHPFAVGANRNCWDLRAYDASGGGAVAHGRDRSER